MSFILRYTIVILFLLGLFFILSLFFPVNPLSSPDINILLKKVIGATATILGAMLTTNGLLGETRLKQWEANLEASVNSSHSRLSNLYSGVGCLVISARIFGIIFFLGIGVFAWLFYMSDANLRPTLEIDFPLMMFCISATISPLIFMFASPEILWLMSLPYRLLDKMVVKKDKRSTLVVIGFLLTVIGIILTTF